MEAELTLTEESSREMFKVLEEQDKIFMEALLNMDELMAMIADRPQGMMEMARAIKKECMKHPTYSDCHLCECFDKFEGECKLGEPAGWPIDEEEGEE